jgi:PPOX class probable F420-dependent enzyme
MIDTTTEAGVRASKRLEDESVIWLTTVRSDGQPQSSPVWFLWDGESFLIYSQPQAQKVRNIAGHPQVSLHLDSDGRGGDIVSIDGQATIERDALGADGVPAYVDKYRDAITAIGYTPETLAQSFSTPIRVVPQRIRTW